LANIEEKVNIYLKNNVLFWENNIDPKYHHFNYTAIIFIGTSLIFVLCILIYCFYQIYFIKPLKVFIIYLTSVSFPLLACCYFLCFKMGKIHNKAKQSCIDFEKDFSNKP
jgi:magnesium-transporting ATPase (P-type)